MWKQQKLGEVAKLKNGFAFKSKDYSDEGTPVIRISDIKDNLVTTTEAKRVPMENEYEGYKIEEGSILIAMSGATTGKFGIYKSKEVALQNQRVGKFVYDEDKITNKFLYYLLYNLKRKILKEAYGGAQPNISSKKIEEMEVNLPSPPAQHRIVEKIEELFSDLDNGIENLKKARKQLETYKQAILKAAFEGKLTKEWREQQDELLTTEELKQQIEEERKKYREQQLKEWEQEVKEWKEAGEPGRKPWKPRKPKELDPINEDELKQFDNIPNYWGVEKLGNLFSVHVGSTPKRKEPKYWGGEINWVSSGEVGFRRIKETEEKITRSGLENSSTDVHPVGTVMLGMIGQGKTRGQAAILDIPAAHNQNTAAIRVPELDYSPELLYYYFYYSYRRTREIGSGNNQKALNKNRVRNIKYLVISPSEQKVLIEKIESRFSIVEQVSKTIEQELQKSKALRQSILKKAFSGEFGG